MSFRAQALVVGLFSLIFGALLMALSSVLESPAGGISFGLLAFVTGALYVRGVFVEERVERSVDDARIVFE